MTIARLWQPFRFQGRDTSTRGLLKKSLGGPAGEKKKKERRNSHSNRPPSARLPSRSIFSIFSIFMYFYLGTSHATKRELPLDKLKRCLIAPHQISNRILGGPRALCRVHPGGLVGSHRRLRFGFYIPCVPRGRRCQGAVTRARMCSRGGGRGAAKLTPGKPKL